ncbi:MAG: hypothetical protein AUJ34_01350 [Parcubacteria group bacterium CG1_02_41_12]|nr:MAG: hypothetical protein AUJ34_01350 [Parcubacteria group bacterium CG1_02_41_12]
MNITIQNPSTHSRNLLRRAGYAMQQNQKGEINFVRRIHGADYPRFHLYVNKEEPGKFIEISLHLDEKKPSYEGQKAHSGEYDGLVLEQERDRILSQI